MQTNKPYDYTRTMGLFGVIHTDYAKRAYLAYYAQFIKLCTMTPIWSPECRELFARTEPIMFLHWLVIFRLHISITFSRPFRFVELVYVLVKKN